jgi:hypothetical protein
MPVSAAAWNRISGIAFIADIKKSSEGTASAIADILHGLFMDFGHSFSIKFQILFSINPEYLLYSTHDNTPCIT